jgi:hypothetical protein
MNIFTRSSGPGGETSIQKLLRLPDPLLSFKWRTLELPFGHNVDYVESVDIPFLNIAVGDKAHVAASYNYYPSTHDIAAFSITLYEDSKVSSLKWVTDWKSKVKDLRTGLYGLPGVDGSGYKQNISVYLMDTANNKILNVRLLGCWPSDTGNLPLNYTDSGRLTLTQTFSIDNQELEFLT